MTTWIILFFGVAAISSASILVRFLPGVPAVVIAFWRLTFASLMTFAVAGLKKELHLPTKKDVLPVLVGGVLLGLHFVAWFQSLKLTSVASSVVLVTTAPIWIALVENFWLKERLSLKEWFGICLAVLGGVLVGYGDFGLSTKALLGDFLALVGAWLISFHFIIGRRLRKTISLFNYTSLIYPVAALSLLLGVVFSQASFFNYHPNQFFLFFLLALFPQMIGHTSLNWALKHLKASTVVVTVLGEPIGASFLAFLFFAEMPPLLTIFGGVIILSGIFITASAQTRVL